MNALPKTSRFAVLFALLLAPVVVQANPGLHHGGFVHGLVHPVFGLDHICAMLAVGLWAAQRGGKAILALPLTFVGAMIVGAWLAKAGVYLPQVELGILLSVLVLGLLIGAAVRLPLAISAALVGVFALFHGHAHALETPANVSGLTYSLGFVLSTAALHFAGLGIGLSIARFGKMQWVRFAGGVIALCGVVLLAS